MPVTWKYNKKTWMTGQSMREWFQDLDWKMAKEKGNRLFILDKSFYPLIVYQLVKIYYRSLILKHLLVNIATAVTAFVLITSLVAINFANNSWDQVTKETFKNCFRKTGFKHESMQSEYQLTEAVAYDPEDDLPLNVLADILKNKNYWNGLITKTLINIDKNLYVEIENPVEIQKLSQDSNVDEFPVLTYAIPNYGYYPIQPT